MFRTRSSLSRLVADRDGATAVEFSLIVFPLIIAIAAIMQTGFTLWASQNLDEGLQRAVRSLLTGSFQMANSTQTDPAVILANLKTSMCNNGTAKVVTVFDCQNVKLDVTLGATFSSLSAPSPFDTSTKTWKTSAGTQYSCATPGSIVIVSAAVKLPTFFGFLNAGTLMFSDGSTLLQSVAVFRTEPYQTTSTTSCT